MIIHLLIFRLYAQTDGDDQAKIRLPYPASAYADYPDMIMSRVKVSEILDRNGYRFFRKTTENEISWNFILPVIFMHTQWPVSVQYSEMHYQNRQ